MDMSTTIDILQDQMLKAIRDAKEAKRLYESDCRAHLASAEGRRGLSPMGRCKKQIAAAVTALEALVGVP